MTIFHALILSLVEGITEFLPVSSTGHLILTTHLLGLEQSEFLKSFEIVIQIGAIAAVAALYTRYIIQKPSLLRPIITAFVPSMILGAVFYTFIKSFLLSNDMIVVVSLALGGLLMVIIDRSAKKESRTHIDQLSTSACVYIGTAQALAFIPGVSRAAATIIGGLLLGLSRREAVEFSFFLAIPTMIAATSLDLVSSSFAFTYNEWILLAIGTIGSGITAYISVKAFIKYVQNHTLAFFGIYRLVIATLYFLLAQR